MRLLAEAIRRAEVRAIVLCDRGFRRVSWVQLLHQLRLVFVVRLMDDVHFELAPGSKVALADVLLTQGRLLDLGVVPLRSDGNVHARVIGYWAPGAHEPWWLATSETGPTSRVLKLYDRRMTVEELFRNTKGRRASHLDATGIHAARRDPSLQLRHRKKGPRQSAGDRAGVILDSRSLPSKAGTPRRSCVSVAHCWCARAGTRARAHE